MKPPTDTSPTATPTIANAWSSLSSPPSSPLISVTSVGASPKPIRPAMAIKAPIDRPRSSLGSSTVNATEVMRPVTVPARISMKMTTAKEVTLGMTGNRAAGTPMIAATTAP